MTEPLALKVTSLPKWAISPEFREPLGKRLGKSYRITGKESAADGSTVYQFDDSGQMAWVGAGECELLTDFVEQRQLELFNGL